MKTYTDWKQLKTAAGTDKKDGSYSEFFAYLTVRPTFAFVEGMRGLLGAAEGDRMTRDVYQQTKVANRSAATSKSDKVSPEELQRTTMTLVKQYRDEAIAAGSTPDAAFDFAMDKAAAEAHTEAKATHDTLQKVSKTEYLRICCDEDFVLKEVFAGHNEDAITEHLTEHQADPDRAK